MRKKASLYSESVFLDTFGDMCYNQLHKRTILYYERRLCMKKDYGKSLW